jgi:hypothetical protein
MKELPIPFTGPMVRALLDDRKGQTRRVVKPTKCKELGVPLAPCEVAGEVNNGDYRYSPYGEPGDRLWVRETWACHFATNDQKPRDIDPELWSVRYFADDFIRPAKMDGSLAQLNQCTKRRPGMFMPRWASRVTLEVTGVRVERLQDITRADAKAEGLKHVTDGGTPYGVPGMANTWFADPRLSYRALWETINGPGSWEANPWVWVVEFRRLAS